MPPKPEAREPEVAVCPARKSTDGFRSCTRSIPVSIVEDSGEEADEVEEEGEENTGGGQVEEAWELLTDTAAESTSHGG